MNKINFLEKTNVTYIIIGIFILFALIHLYKINSNTTEPFAVIGEDSSVRQGVVIDIPELNQVRFGTNKTGLNTLLDNKANASDLATKANASDLALVTTAANNAMPELSIIAYGGGNTLPPGWQLCDGEVLRYYKSTPSVPLFLDNIIVTTSDARFNNLSKQTIPALSGDYYITPDLRGRFILGTGQGKELEKNSNGNVIAVKGSTNLDIPLTNRGIKDVGGKETHKLTEDEIPTHNHTHKDRIHVEPHPNGNGFDYAFQRLGFELVDYTADPQNQASNGDWQHWGGWGVRKIWGKNDITGNVGEDTPHENMPPFYVLTYIIKQPIKL